MRLRFVHHVLVSILGLLPAVALAGPGDAAGRLGLFIGLFLPLAYLAPAGGFPQRSRGLSLPSVAAGATAPCRAVP